MNYWFIVHDLKAYEQHKDLIGCRIKQSGTQQPWFRQFAEIKKGDKIAYYATKNNVIVGIFVIDSDMRYLANDPHWNSMVFDIRPASMPPDGYYVDFKKALLTDKQAKFDLFPKKEKWYSYLQGKTCRKLTEHDYRLVSEYLETPEFLVRIGDLKVTETKWHKKRAEEETKQKETKGSLHQRVIDKWKAEEEKKFGLFKPYIKTNTVDLNDILPESIWLTENKKYVDALAKLEIGSQPIYQSILEVQHKGSKEDLCVRVSVILPFVTRIDIVSDESILPQIKELLERIADANIVKSRVRFYSFKDFLAST